MQEYDSKSRTVTSSQPLDLSCDFDMRFGKDELDGVAQLDGQVQAGDGPLSPEHFDAIEDANKRKRTIDKAYGMASFNAWSTGVFAALSLPFAFFDLTSLVMAVGLSFVAANEFKGRKELKSLKVGSLNRLMWNQLIFAFMLVGYGTYQILAVGTGPGKYAEQIRRMPELAQGLGSMDDLTATLTYAVYGSIIVVSIIFQGGTALYYHRKKNALLVYISETPDWVLSLQKR